MQTLTIQVLGQVMAGSCQLKPESRWQGMDAFHNVLRSSGVLCCGRKDLQTSLRFSVSNCSGRGAREPELWRSQFRSGRSDGRFARKCRRKAVRLCSVLNEAEQNSKKVPLGSAGAPDVLKDQLEALQDEALQVRNRYNNAKARFMRLTEVAQQLRRRAAIDLKLGNEDSARKALVEKQKVIQAAELSKRRAQLLEELSTKLGEAISAKETQYIVFLSTPQREEPTVRVVSPTEDGPTSVDRHLDGEENSSGLGTAEASRIYHEGTDSVDLAAAATEGMNGDSRQVVQISGDVLLEREKLSFSAELGYSTDRLISGNDDNNEQAAVPVHDSYNVKFPVEGEEFVRDDRDINVQSGGSQLPKDSLDGESLARDSNGAVDENILDSGVAYSISDISDVDGLTSGTEYVDSRDGSEQMGTACHKSVGHSDRIEYREVSANAPFNDGQRRSVERLILDVDHQVTTIELRLKMEVSRNLGLNDSELRMVGDLLEQVQSLRARISEVVVLLPRKEMQ